MWLLTHVNPCLGAQGEISSRSEFTAYVGRYIRMSSRDDSRHSDFVAEASKKKYYDLETPDTDSPMPAPPSTPLPSAEKSGSKMADSRDVDGAFEGSFAGTARDIAIVRPQPWYYRREYYLDGWADPIIRRAAVSVVLFCPQLVYHYSLTTNTYYRVVR
jgi:hypothetical protein